MNKREILEQVASGTINVDEALREIQQHESGTMVNIYTGERLERLRTQLEPYVEAAFYEELGTYEEIAYSELVKLVEKHISQDYINSMAAIGIEIDVRTARKYAIHDVSLGFAEAMVELEIEGVNSKSLLKSRIHGLAPTEIAGFIEFGIEGSLRQYIKMAIHNVDLEFIQELLGLDMGLDLTANSLIKLRIHGVSAQYIRGLQESGIEGTLNEYRKMAVHGVDASFVQEMTQLGLGDLTPRDYVQMRIHGLDSTKVSDFRSIFPEITFNEMLVLAIHGIDGSYVQGFRELGYDNITPREVKKLRIHGVDSDLIASLQAVGFTDLPINKVLKMAVHNVTIEFATNLGKAGLEDISVNELIQFRVHGVDPRFVAKVIAIGYQPTPQQLVHLKIHGVDIEDIAHGYVDGMSIQQVIRYYR